MFFMLRDVSAGEMLPNRINVQHKQAKRDELCQRCRDLKLYRFKGQKCLDVNLNIYRNVFYRISCENEYLMLI